MTQNLLSYQLLLPVLIYALYILFMYFFMFLVRAKSVASGKTSIKYFKTYNTTEVDPYVLVVGRHLENQYELPMLFFILNILTIILNFSSPAFLILAWTFVGLRLAHSFVHLTSNKVGLRAKIFGLGLLVLIIQTFLILFFSLYVMS